MFRHWMFGSITLIYFAITLEKFSVVVGLTRGWFGVATILAGVTWGLNVILGIVGITRYLVCRVAESAFEKNKKRNFIAPPYHHQYLHIYHSYIICSGTGSWK